MRKVLAVGIILLFIGASVVSGVQIKSSNNSQPLSRGWLYVGGTGEGNYTVIQEAIDDANPGDTVFVYNGTYYERVVVDKTIHLIGEDRNTTVIDGGDWDYSVRLSSDGVTISGFTIQNGQIGIYLDSSSNNTITGNTATSNNNGIRLTSSSNNTITGNIAHSNNVFGIHLESSSNNTIMGNNASNNWAGIILEYSSNNIITGNTASNTDYGIYLGHFGHSSNNNTVMGNIAHSNNDIGIILDHSSNNTITGNNASNNEHGIHLGSSSNNTIMGNNASNNIEGIILEYSSDNTIMGNTAHSNDDAGIILLTSNYNNIITDNTVNSNNDWGIYLGSPSNNNHLYHNNLINNTQNAADHDSNTWDDGYPSGGNYWSDYTGTDGDGDGIGDTPYNIFGGSNQDRYPLVLRPNYSPGQPDQPTGETNGKINTAYTYTTSTSDSDGDQVYYMWEWGDGSTSSWLGPYDSGDEATADHTWTTKGDYSIKVKAKDTEDAESDWSEPLAITMPVSYDYPIVQFLKLLFERFPNAFSLLRHLMGY